MGIGRIVGIALLALGVVLLFFGLSASNTFMEKIVRNVTGEYTNQTMWYLIGGSVSAVVGLGLTIFGARKENT